MKTFLSFKLSIAVFIMLMNVKMPTIVGILSIMSMIPFMLSAEHEKKFYNLGPRVRLKNTAMQVKIFLYIVSPEFSFISVWLTFLHGKK